MNSDKTSTVISHLEYLMTQQHKSPRTHEQYVSLHVTTLQPVTTSVTLKIDFGTTVTTLVRQCLQLCVSATDVDRAKTTHTHQDNLQNARTNSQS